jgi:hypothetical protein
MLHFLKEHSGVVDPDEVHTLVAALDKAWQTVRASGVTFWHDIAVFRGLVSWTIAADHRANVTRT